MKASPGWCFLFALTAQAVADWDVRRFEGRDYVPLEQVAEFYQLPPPPHLVDQGGSALQLVNFVPAPFPQAPFPLLTPSSSVTLQAGKQSLFLTLGSREVQINGLRHWLSFPIIVQKGTALLSRLDLAKVIEPHFRPEKIADLRMVETVVLDPGHGGHDSGATSSLGVEKNFTLDVALRARTLLEKQGYKVVMTRSADLFVPLEQRAALANGITNAIFVSIHFNQTATNRDARGFEIYSMAPRGAPATNDQTVSVSNLRQEPGNTLEVPSAALAGSIHAALLGQVPVLDRGLKQARFAVLRLCTAPAVLIECGFVSNAQEVAQISSTAWRAQVAEAIVDGIDGYKLLAEKRLAPKSVADYQRKSGATAN